MKHNKLSCQIIGTGRAGRALTLAMSQAGYRFTWIGSKRGEKAEELAKEVGCRSFGVGFDGFDEVPGFLIIAVPDNQISIIASTAADRITGNNTIVAHLSGALGSDVLNDVRIAGASAMAFHPAQTFTTESDPEAVFKGICFDMEGDDPACRFGEELALALGAQPVKLRPEQRIRTHLAMSVASNFTVALMRMAEDIMRNAQIDDKTARKMLIPLFRQTASNIIDSGTGTALTGPIARGDSTVIRKHLAVLKDMEDTYSSLYRAIANIILDMSVERGDITDERASKLLCNLKNRS